MRKNLLALITALLLAPLASLHVSAATVDDFGFGWKFAKGDQRAAIFPNFDDSKWEHVDLPHDWAISGPFGPLNESGGTGKLPWSGGLVSQTVRAACHSERPARAVAF